jgi:multidrug efflux pump
VSPKDAERLLIRPLETSLRGIDGLKEITSIAAQSYAGIVLEFNIETDKDQIIADIRDKVDQAKAQLPADAEEPIVTETNFSLQPTIIVTLSGKVPERTLYNFARKLKDEVESVSSVREAKLSGNREEMLEIVLDLMKLESYDISQSELLTALSQYNQLVPAGFLDDGNGRFNVKVPGLVENAMDVYSIPIKQNGEGVVTLGEVAEIRRTFKDPSNFTRVNGEPAISLDIIKRLGANIIENNEEVRRVVAAFSKNWPATIKINYILDQSSQINETQSSLESSILTAIALVMIIVVGTLGLRTGLLVGLSIPVSFMVGFLILTTIGYTLNMMIMFGMVLTVGMLVDGAIVVTEYADRKMAEGMPAEEAYHRAARLMFWPVFSSTATTLAAFLPLLLWPGVVGKFMSYLPIMVIIVLTASLITAMIFIPTTGTMLGKLSGWAGRHADWMLSLVVGVLLTALAVFGLLSPVLSAITGLSIDMVLASIGGTAGEWGIDFPVMQIAWLIAAVLALAVAMLAHPLVSRFVKWRASRPVKEDIAAKMLSSKDALDIAHIPGITGGYLRFLKLASGIFDF